MLVSAHTPPGHLPVLHREVHLLDAQFETGVLEGLDGPVTPLSREDLDSARNLVRQARARQAA